MLRLRVLPAALIIFSFFVSCKRDGQNVQINENSSNSREARVLVLWTHEYPTYTGGLREKWIPEFEAAHPGVKVDYKAYPYSGDIVTFDSKLLAEVSGGGGPDVWSMASHNFTQGRYIEAGLLEPLDPEVFGYKSVEDIETDYPENSLRVFVRNGKIYAMVSELTTLCLFYNKTMFDEAGIPYLPENKPVSWKTIREISQKLLKLDASNGKPIQMGYQFGFFANYPSPEWYIQDFYPILRQYGQDDLFINSKPAANTTAMLNTFQEFYDFTFSSRAYDPYFVNDWFKDFAVNRVAMVTAGSWYPSAIRGINPDIKFGCAPHPVADPDNPASYSNIMYSFGWVVNANSKPEQKKLAQEFIAFILGKKGEAEQPVWWLKNVGMMQPRKAFLESDGYREILTDDPWMKRFVDTYDTYNVDYYQHSSDEAGAALVRAINRVVYNKMPPRETAQLLQNELILLH